MLVATIREYPWSAPKMWAVVWEQYSRDGVNASTVHAVPCDSESKAAEVANGAVMKNWPNHAPRVVEVVHGSENRLLIDVKSVIDSTVGDVFRAGAYRAETLKAVYDLCETSYAGAMQSTGMTESAAP